MAWTWWTDHDFLCDDHKRPDPTKKTYGPQRKRSRRSALKYG